MGVSLQVLFGSADSVELEPEDLPATIGRHPEAAVQVTDHWVSRLHCELTIRNDSLVIEDLRSANGTLVNGALVRVATLQPGDQFQVGLTEYRIQYDPAELGAAQCHPLTSPLAVSD